MPILKKSEVPYNAIVYEKKCSSCGIIFYAKRPKGVYCSDLCRCHAYLERSKNRPAKTEQLKKLYFKTKQELAYYLKKSGYKKDFYSLKWDIGERSYIRIELKKYVIERISFKEYTLEEKEEK